MPLKLAVFSAILVTSGLKMHAIQMDLELSLVFVFMKTHGVKSAKNATMIPLRDLGFFLLQLTERIW